MYNLDLSNKLVRRGAEQEADAFALPTNWAEAREPRTAIAIDDAEALELDDALAVTPAGSEAHTLHVGIANPGAFLYDKPCTVISAIRAVRSMRTSKESLPLLNPAITRELRLFENEERPALTTHLTVQPDGFISSVGLSHEQLTTKRLTPLEADNMLQQQSGELYEEVHTLHLAALALHAMRLPAHAASQRFERQNAQTPHKIIVEEAMLATSSMIAQLARAYDIPVLFRNRIEGAEVRTFYGATPWHDTDAKRQQLAPFTAPLRDAVALVNHINISAFMSERPLPFSGEDLQEISDRLNRLRKSDKLYARMQQKDRRASETTIDELLSDDEAQDTTLWQQDLWP